MIGGRTQPPADTTMSTHAKHAKPSKPEPEVEAEVTDPGYPEPQAPDVRHESYGLPRWHGKDEAPPTAADGTRESGYLLWLVGEDQVFLTSWDTPPAGWRAWISIPKLSPTGVKVPFDAPGTIRIPYGEDDPRGQIKPDQKPVKGKKSEEKSEEDY